MEMNKQYQSLTSAKILRIHPFIRRNTKNSKLSAFDMVRILLHIVQKSKVFEYVHKNRFDFVFASFLAVQRPRSRVNNSQMQNAEPCRKNSSCLGLVTIAESSLESVLRCL